MAYDVVIRNGTVVDGSGGERFRADVGIIGDRIATIGRISEHGRTEVDAEGHFVAPGFIDGHTHLDAQVFWDPLGTSASWHGVTSVVMGNCGFTLAPSRSSERDLVLRTLERAEDMAREVLLAGVDFRWETYPEYLDVLDAMPKGINYAGYLGHSAVRTFVMGERAFEQASSEEDLAAMCQVVESSIRAGALGLSTSRAPAHQTADGSPVASRLAEWSEVCTLVEVMGKLGAGSLEIVEGTHPDAASNARCLERFRELSVATGRPVLAPSGAHNATAEQSAQFVSMLDHASASGGQMIGEVNARQFISIVGFKVKLPFDKLPVWQEFRSTSLDAQRQALMDPEFRSRLVDEATGGSYGTALGTAARAPLYDSLYVLDARVHDVMGVLDNRAGHPRTVADVAAERHCTPVDVIIDLSLETNFECLFAQPFSGLDLTEVLAMLRHPHTVIAISDSGAHVTEIIDSSIPTFFLAHWVRREEAFTWEQAVRMLTFDPASVWQFTDRGLVREGFVADLAIFDPRAVGPAMPAVATDLPSGAKRLTQRAHGMLATLVNGQVLLLDGQHTGALPGQLLRGRSGQSPG